VPADLRAARHGAEHQLAPDAPGWFAAASNWVRTYADVGPLPASCAAKAQTSRAVPFVHSSVREPRRPAHDPRAMWAHLPGKSMTYLSLCPRNTDHSRGGNVFLAL